MPIFRDPTKPEDIPPPTAEGRLLSAFVEGFVATHPQAEALALLRATASVLHDREAKSSVIVRLKKADREKQRAEAEADRQAVALFRQMLEGAVARLLPEGDED